MHNDSLKEFRTFGPPGTGKTTFLSRQVERAASTKGSQNVLVCSFTKAAVRELNRRELPIPEQNIGTLHALAYRALGQPTICEDAEGFKAFADYCKGKYNLSASTMENVDDGRAATTESNGDNAILANYSLVRSTMTAQDYWPHNVKAFATVWERFKQEVGMVDFTDLIEMALRDVPRHPADPLVGFFDEAQDFTPAELALVRQWGQHMENIVLCADDDQMIYGFKGAKVESILNPPLPEEHIRILAQSYRVPRQVHKLANTYIKRIPKQWRQQKEYHPRDAEGEVRVVRDTFKAPKDLIPLASEYINQGKTVLFLASCSYMLNPLIKLLRSEGLAFSNPWRRRRADWNPLFRVTSRAGKRRDGENEGHSTLEMVSAFFQAKGRDLVLWTGRELKLWTKLLKGVTIRGVRPFIDALPDNELVPVSSMIGFMPMEAAVAALKCDPVWLMSNIRKRYASPAEYAIQIFLKNGVSVLEKEPSLYVGTIHSLKGGEADVVILFPDISPQAASGGEDTLIRGKYSSNEPFQHQIIRQFYVGMTRAKETLIVCSPANPKFYATIV